MKEQKYKYGEGTEHETIIIDRGFCMLMTKKGEPPISVYKHKMEVDTPYGPRTVKHSKVENYISLIRENIIELGLKTGSCKKLPTDEKA